MRWRQGSDVVERLLQDRHVEKVPPNEEHASRLLDQAQRHLGSAGATAETDPEGAYGMLYDAARKAMWALLAQQGLRPTTAGGHLAVHEAVTAQMDPPLGKIFRPFGRMRRTRNASEYPDADTPRMSSDEVRDALKQAEAIVDACARVRSSMGPY